MAPIFHFHLQRHKIVWICNIPLCLRVYSTIYVHTNTFLFVCIRTYNNLNFTRPLWAAAAGYRYLKIYTWMAMVMLPPLRLYHHHLIMYYDDWGVHEIMFEIQTILIIIIIMIEGSLFAPPTANNIPSWIRRFSAAKALYFRICFSVNSLRYQHTCSNELLSDYECEGESKYNGII